MLIEPCGIKTFSLGIQLGIPFPQIITGYTDPCRREITLSTLKYDKDTQIEWSIYDKGTLTSTPNIYYSYQNEVFIELPSQRIFNNSYFYLKLKVTTKCGIREVVQKIQLQDKDCKNIEYIVSPNPSDGLVNLQLAEYDMIHDIRKIFVRNSITNDLVYSKEIVFSIDDLNIDLSHLPNAFYIISIENSEFQLFTKSLQIFK